MTLAPPLFHDGEQDWELVTANSFLEYRPRCQRQTTRSLPRHFRYEAPSTASPEVGVAARPRRQRGKKCAAQRAAAAHEEEQLLREAVARAAAEARAGVAPPPKPTKGRRSCDRMLGMLGALTTQQRLRAKVKLHALAETLLEDRVTELTLKRPKAAYFLGPDDEATEAFLQQLTDGSWHKAELQADGRRVGVGCCNEGPLHIVAFPRLGNEADVARAEAALADEEGKRQKVVVVTAEWTPLPRTAQLLLERLGRRWRSRILVLIVAPKWEAEEERDSYPRVAAAVQRLRWWPGESAADVVAWLRK